MMSSYHVYVIFTCCITFKVLRWFIHKSSYIHQNVCHVFTNQHVSFSTTVWYNCRFGHLWGKFQNHSKRYPGFNVQYLDMKSSQDPFFDIFINVKDLMRSEFWAGASFFRNWTIMSTRFDYLVIQIITFWFWHRN